MPLQCDVLVLELEPRSSNFYFKLFFSQQKLQFPKDLYTKNNTLCRELIYVHDSTGYKRNQISPLNICV